MKKYWLVFLGNKLNEHTFNFQRFLNFPPTAQAANIYFENRSLQVKKKKSQKTNLDWVTVCAELVRKKLTEEQYSIALFQNIMNENSLNKSVPEDP